MTLELKYGRDYHSSCLHCCRILEFCFLNSSNRTLQYKSMYRPLPIYPNVDRINLLNDVGKLTHKKSILKVNETEKLYKGT